MTKEEQRNLVTVLATSVVHSVLVDISEGKVPEDWDGHELRELLADRFSRQRTDAVKGKRKTAYTHTLIVNGL